jgi:CubicO group peptidase (beta-lactamase class C family)
MRRKIKIIIGLVLIAALVYGVVYAYRALPIISGYGAKAVCSCVFISGRSADDVITKELGSSPLSLGSFAVDLKDSSASGNVFGFAKRKAIYRKGLGCTLINELSESDVRSQKTILATRPTVNQDSVLWPMGNLYADTVVPNIDLDLLNTAVNEAFAEPTNKPLRRTRAVIVLYNGKIVAEKYDDSFNANKPHTGWSMTKSITSALVGILVKQGKLKIEDKNLFSEWNNDERKNIKLDNLLHANSGLKWDEVYTKPSPATNMLYRKDDMTGYARSLKADEEPGKHFKYSSGTANIVAGIIRSATGQDYYRFPYEQLFYKIGMYSAVIEPDASGTFVGSSYCFASPRDWARFGLLYLNDGVTNGERILPEGWVKYTTTPATGAAMGEYGALFWLNAGAPGNPNNRKYPKVPTDCFYAAGHEGQYVWIIPSKKLLVVRLSLEQGSDLDENRFLADIINAIH